VTKARRGADQGYWTPPKPGPSDKYHDGTPEVEPTREKPEPKPRVIQIDRRGTADLNKAVAASFGRTAKKLRAKQKGKPTLTFADLMAEVEADTGPEDGPAEDTAIDDFAARFQKNAEARAARMRQGDE
jgi:hypothetical protein